MRSVLAVVALLITAGFAAEDQQTKGKDAPTDEDDGVHDYLWELKENGGVLWVTFDKNDRVKRVAVVLK